jgi:hypothetical protein
MDRMTSQYVFPEFHKQPTDKYYSAIVPYEPIAVAERSKAWTVFAHSNIGVMGSNPTWNMNVCVRLFRLCCPVCR